MKFKLVNEIYMDQNSFSLPQPRCTCSYVFVLLETVSENLKLGRGIQKVALTFSIQTLLVSFGRYLKFENLIGSLIVAHLLKELLWIFVLMYTTVGFRLQSAYTVESRFLEPPGGNANWLEKSKVALNYA